MSAPSDGARADARKRLAEEGPRWSDLFGIDPAFADSEPPTLVIDSGWLCESVNKHTCGAGPGSYGGMHEPGCGLVPVANIADLLAGVIADAKAEALREFGVRLGGHGLVAAIHDPLCPERVTHGSGDRPCHFSGAVTAYDVAESVKTYLRDEVQR